MNEQFSIGEVAIIASISGETRPEWWGENVTVRDIRGGMVFTRMGATEPDYTGVAYLCEHVDGTIGWCKPSWLRKLKPPSWDDIQKLTNWNPTEVTA